ncbi:helix-turn-helix domain-containing protein [Paenibacillus sp. PvP091]|nr:MULTISPECIES: AraC family transcriptional regulator [unclassified Paenibacillus]
MERMKYTSITLEQIAESCGFGGYSYFHRVFKEHYGVSSGVYRSGSGQERTSRRAPAEKISPKKVLRTKRRTFYMTMILC